jgi:CheY-like chemotaxis protein
LGPGRSRERTQTKTILICDDEPSVRELLRILLGAEYEIDEASDGAEALELMRELEPDLVILDVMMPGRSGLDVLGEIREDPAFAGIPVIVVTAWDHMQPDAVAAGADRFFLKPFEADDLKTAVAELLEESS